MRELKYELKVANVRDMKSFARLIDTEIDSIIREVRVDYDSPSIRTDLSTQFRQLFEGHNWETGSSLWFTEGKGRTPHYVKKDLLAQVSWRHYGMIGTELLLFEVDFRKGSLKTGVFICVTEDLIEVIDENYKGSGKTNPFDGSITQSKAMDYASSVKKIVTIPLAFIGLMPS